MLLTVTCLADDPRTVSIWWLWWRPFLTLQYPSVLWGSLTYGVVLGWIVLQQTANASALPILYGFNAISVGNSYWTVRIPILCEIRADHIVRHRRCVWLHCWRTYKRLCRRICGEAS